MRNKKKQNPKKTKWCSISTILVYSEIAQAAIVHSRHIYRCQLSNAHMQQVHWQVHCPTLDDSWFAGQHICTLRFSLLYLSGLWNENLESWYDKAGQPTHFVLDTILSLRAKPVQHIPIKLSHHRCQHLSHPPIGNSGGRNLAVEDTRKKGDKNSRVLRNLQSWKPQRRVPQSV